MLGIFGKKSDHPLADIKSAQKVLEEVPKNDPLNTVQELTSWIESILELADDFRLDHEFAVLRMFDEAAQPHVRKLLRDYFAMQPASKFQENRLWTVLNGFYTQSELVYYDVLSRYLNNGRGAAGIKPDHNGGYKVCDYKSPEGKRHYHWSVDARPRASSRYTDVPEQGGTRARSCRRPFWRSAS